MRRFCEAALALSHAQQARRSKKKNDKKRGRSEQEEKEREQQVLEQGHPFLWPR